MIPETPLDSRSNSLSLWLDLIDLKMPEPPDYEKTRVSPWAELARGFQELFESAKMSSLPISFSLIGSDLKSSSCIGSSFIILMFYLVVSSRATQNCSKFS